MAGRQAESHIIRNKIFIGRHFTSVLLTFFACLGMLKRLTSFYYDSIRLRAFCYQLNSISREFLLHIGILL